MNYFNLAILLFNAIALSSWIYAIISIFIGKDIWELAWSFTVCIFISAFIYCIAIPITEDWKEIFKQEKQP